MCMKPVLQGVIKNIIPVLSRQKAKVYLELYGYDAWTIMFDLLIKTLLLYTRGTTHKSTAPI